MSEVYSPPRDAALESRLWNARDFLNLAVLLLGVVPAVAFPTSAIVAGVLEEVYGHSVISERFGIFIAFLSMGSCTLGTVVASLSVLKKWGASRRLRLASMMCNGVILLLWFLFAAWVIWAEFGDPTMGGAS